MCQITHEIDLINLKNNEIINNELLLIKGTIKNRCATNTVVLKNHQSKTIDFFLSDNTSNFKFLIQLNSRGQNRYEIHYCKCCHILILNFQQSESSYQIQPLYIICKNHNGYFQSNQDPPKANSPVEACKIIELNLKLVQCLYAEKLLESGLTSNLRKTFTLTPSCLIFHSKIEVSRALQLDENTLWNELAYEIINSDFGVDPKLKFIAFLGCTQYDGFNINGDFSYQNIKKHAKANPALGGGGLALFGSGFFYAWPRHFEEILPCFKNNKKVDLNLHLDDSNYRRTFGGCFATTLGAVAHELGHCFDLGHTIDGIMGNGFDYVNQTFLSENLTEILPDRVVQVEKPRDQRLTKIKKAQNNFLDKYREQKTGGDSTYFAKNCAIILAHHKWLNQVVDEKNNEIQFIKSEYKIKSKENLILIEVREKLNGLVVEYYDFLNKIEKEFQLPLKYLNFEKYNIFAINIKGNIMLLEY